MKTTGYSKTSLAKKLGIKDNFNIRIINAPEYYFKLFSDLPIHLEINANRAGKKDFIHYFETSAETLNSTLPKLKKEIQPNGIIWISWYKKSAKKDTDITEDIIRDIALKNSMVDIKVCAIDEIWSGLKLVIRLKDRILKDGKL
ncbi:MAG: DUF3052 domain-containing protein [Ignavibacteriales bacterium]|nr:DUF3052 domain-containing protein [Ignavibacteriales bacterium]